MIKITDIEDIKKFSQDKDAWYHIKVPSHYSQEDIVFMKRILDDGGISGTILLTTEDITVTDITEHVKDTVMEE